MGSLNSGWKVWGCKKTRRDGTWREFCRRDLRAFPFVSKIWRRNVRKRTQLAASSHLLLLPIKIQSLLSSFLSLHTHSSKPRRESSIVLRENYKGENRKAFRLWGAGHEGACSKDLLLGMRSNDFTDFVCVHIYVLVCVYRKFKSYPWALFREDLLGSICKVPSIRKLDTISVFASD